MDNDTDSDFSDNDCHKAAAISTALAAVMPLLLPTKQDPMPRNNSVHTAKDRIAELMATIHAGRFRDAMRMNKPTFMTLVQVLKDRAGMRDKRETTVEETLYMFIQHGMCARSNRSTQELQQRSASTISVAVHEIAEAILSIGEYFIPGPPPRQGPRDFIGNNPKFSPFFDAFDGAVDGTHIPAVISPSKDAVWRDYKNDISMNCLIYFGFDLEVYYMLAGFEGSAHDARLLNTALKDGNFPRQGKEVCGCRIQTNK